MTIGNGKFTWQSSEGPPAARLEAPASKQRANLRPRAAGERSLHTGEVVGSIPTAPTIQFIVCSGFYRRLLGSFGNSQQNTTRNRHLDPWKIRGLCSRIVQG